MILKQAVYSQEIRNKSVHKQKLDTHKKRNTPNCIWSDIHFFAVDVSQIILKVQNNEAHCKF